MTAYYNEFDPNAAAWLRELIAQGHIAPGDVDERSIEDVTPDDLRGYTQCHFFAGIGVWSYALRQAGWPDDRPVWTGSCPCQPFSAAGKGGGFDDERHLWPHFHYLIEQCRPPVVLGEQVASKDGLGWLDLVQADLEGTGYASGAVDTCAAGFGAPHIRQRLWWVAERLAHTDDERSQGRIIGRDGAGQRTVGPGGVAGGLEHAQSDGRQQWRAEPSGRGAPSGCGDVGLADTPSGRVSDEREQRRGQHGFQPQDGSDVRQGHQGPRSGLEGLEHADSAGREPGQRDDTPAGHRPPATATGITGRPGPTNGLWADADWLFCRDGKWRPVEPGTFPLAHGSAARVVRLRGYGNAIVAPAAQAFIEAYLETIDDRRVQLDAPQGVFA